MTSIINNPELNIFDIQRKAIRSGTVYSGIKTYFTTITFPEYLGTGTRKSQ